MEWNFRATLTLFHLVHFTFFLDGAKLFVWTAAPVCRTARGPS